MVHDGSRRHRPGSWEGDGLVVLGEVAKAAGVKVDFVVGGCSRLAVAFRRVAWAALRDMGYSYGQIGGLTGWHSATSVRTGIMGLEKTRRDVARQIAARILGERRNARKRL